MIPMKPLLGTLGNMSYLTGVAHAADILSLTKEDVYRWTDELKKSANYHTIIFYLGTYSEAFSEVMNISDKVYIANHGSDYENTVYTVWSKQMERSGIKVEGDKFINLRLDKEDHLGGERISFGELRGTATWSMARKNMRE